MSNLLYKAIENKIEAREEEDNFIEIPAYITKNLKQELREYQKKALKHFIFYMQINKIYKSIERKHLLFHMATGSGKTNIMASSILYLYSLGYNNFIFFVNNSNIISKTKDNLINKYSNKYLFSENIKIDNKNIEINEIVSSFDEAKDNCINILFTTIHKLHQDLETTLKENSITYEDFKNKKLVLIADEAHHLNANTKTQKDSEKNWEATTKNLLRQNSQNILLEFTATQDLEDKNVALKYKDKIIFDYALKSFRDDKYSKDIVLISDSLNQDERILQALMISEYRKIVANEILNLNLKPVVLFKTVKNTDDIDKIYENFLYMVENLRVNDIENIFQKSSLKSIENLKKRCSSKELLKALQYGFKESSTLVIHSKTSNKEEKLKYLNSLEDVQNPIRAIFAVDILNEGWDVLNLFDIVKLDEIKNSASSTISEAQLIGRGARYFPFAYKNEDKYKRKFDTFVNEEEKIIEQMYFHSINQSDYINSIRKELVKIGLIDENSENENIVELKLKDKFLQSDFYKYGYIFTNKQIAYDRSNINKIEDYDIKYKNQKFYIDNKSLELDIFSEDEVKEESNFSEVCKFEIGKIEKYIVRSAINKRPFYYFANLKKYFVNLRSIDEFISSSNYLANVLFTFHTSKKFELTNEQMLKYILIFLEKLENEIIKNSAKKIGSHKFFPHRVNSKIPTTKMLKQKSSSAKISRVEDWYVFEPHDCTSEEQHFVEFIKSVIPKLREKYDDILLIRNEKSFEIYSFDKKYDGARFEPDFILILQDKNRTIHQIFCEPKGDWAKDKKSGFDDSSEKWKNDFLLDITACTNSGKISLEDINEQGLALYESKNYKILGLPFYNYEEENEFKKEFENMFYN